MLRSAGNVNRTTVGVLRYAVLGFGTIAVAVGVPRAIGYVVYERAAAADVENPVA